MEVNHRTFCRKKPLDNKLYEPRAGVALETKRNILSSAEIQTQVVQPITNNFTRLFILDHKRINK
jgi:hypothetical protein